MKKLLLFVLIGVSIGTASHAQRRGRRAASALKVGMNVNYLTADVPGDNATRIGLSIGIAPTIPLQGGMYFKPELSYAMKGGRIDYDDQFSGFIGEGNVLYRLNYLEFPLVWGFSPRPGFALEVGLYGALEIGGTFDFEGQFLRGFGTFGRDDINDFDYGFTAGIKIGPLGVR